jgi:hypothetical protein
MVDDTDQTIGRIEGKLDALTVSVQSYQISHNMRHQIIDQHIDSIKADINMAKGAKGAIIAMVATVSAVTSAGIIAALRWFR